MAEKNYKKKKATETEAVTETQAVEQQPVSEASEAAPKAKQPSRQELMARIAALEGTLDALTSDPADGMVTRFGVTLKEGTVISDPYSSQSPVTFKAHPPGFRLSWCNPRIRNQIGWNGWTPVTYDSEIGENLDLYLNAVPARLEGVSAQDNYVRRGSTSILCFLPEGVWLHRQMEVERKGRARQHLDADSGTDIRNPDGSVIISGEGLVSQERPDGGFKFKHERGERVNVNRAQGDQQKIVDLIPPDEKTADRALHN